MRELKIKNDRAIRRSWWGLCLSVVVVGAFIYAALTHSGFWRVFYFALAGVNCISAAFLVSGLAIGYSTRKLLCEGVDVKWNSSSNQ